MECPALAERDVDATRLRDRPANREFSGHRLEAGNRRARSDFLFLWIDDPQALDNLEITVVCLGNVHVHSNVMLTGHHFSRTTRPLGDLCVV